MSLAQQKDFLMALATLPYEAGVCTHISVSVPKRTAGPRSAQGRDSSPAAGRDAPLDKVPRNGHSGPTRKMSLLHTDELRPHLHTAAQPPPSISDSQELAEPQGKWLGETASGLPRATGAHCIQQSPQRLCPPSAVPQGGWMLGEARKAGGLSREVAPRERCRPTDKSANWRGHQSPHVWSRHLNLFLTLVFKLTSMWNFSLQPLLAISFP